MTPIGVDDSVNQGANQSRDKDAGPKGVPFLLARAETPASEYPILPSGEGDSRDAKTANRQRNDHRALPLKLSTTNVTRASRSALLSKYFLDAVLATVMVTSLLPIIILIGCALRLGGKPVIYSQTRVGMNGRLFDCYKFRSMRKDADAELRRLLKSDPLVRLEWEENQKLDCDPRVTPFGHFLRRSSLDEIPQFFNVIKGDMSLVGPRPVVEDELERYGAYLPYYLSVRPGLTGLWQVSGRNDMTYRRRVALDVAYVRNASFWLDLAILARTGFSVISTRGAK
jgi:undecaprenyl-phosphate galactose phosphotransferase